MTSPMPLGLERLAAPAPVVEALERLVDSIRQAAGQNLVSLVLFGGLARGRYRPGASDVNLVFVLQDAGPRALDALAATLRLSFRELDVEPMLLTAGEIEAAADVFPTKFLDIKRHHIVLAGQDPFAALEVPRQHVRLRVEQELRNMLLRLRRRYAGALLDRAAMTGTLLSIARPLALDLAFLLELSGDGWPQDDSTAEIYRRAASKFELDAGPLAELAELRAGEGVQRDLAGLYQAVLVTLGRAAAVADRLEESQ